MRNCVQVAGVVLVMQCVGAGGAAWALAPPRPEHGLLLRRNTTVDNVVFRAQTKLYYHDSGRTKLSHGTLARDQHVQGVYLKANTEVRFWSSGRLYVGTLSRDWTRSGIRFN